MKKLILLFILLNIACNSPKDRDDCHCGIKFKNNTDRVLFIRSSSDTILQNYMDPRENSFQHSILPYAGKGNIELGNLRFLRNGSPMCVETLYKNDEKIYIFIHDSIALGNKEWNEVRKNYIVTKRYDLTINELKKLNFTIEYTVN
jgi:hypothetical protein